VGGIYNLVLLLRLQELLTGRKRWVENFNTREGTETHVCSLFHKFRFQGTDLDMTVHMRRIIPITED
jgi:hypothetical protein